MGQGILAVYLEKQLIHLSVFQAKFSQVDSSERRWGIWGIYPGMDLSRDEFIEGWIYPRMDLSRDGFIQGWIYPGMNLSKDGFIQG